jgi:hypothetical protein
LEITTIRGLSLPAAWCILSDKTEEWTVSTMLKYCLKTTA